MVAMATAGGQPGMTLPFRVQKGAQQLAMGWGGGDEMRYVLNVTAI